MIAVYKQNGIQKVEEIDDDNIERVREIIDGNKKKITFRGI